MVAEKICEIYGFVFFLSNCVLVRAKCLNFRCVSNGIPGVFCSGATAGMLLEISKNATKTSWLLARVPNGQSEPALPRNYLIFV